ncbi:MAG: beta-N-acetylhexosaminidase [Eubacteriales bacterium]
MKRFGVMLDCSRNAVMKVEEVKKFASLVKKFGYNMLMLYTEDTYEVENEAYFGYMRGRYTCAEMKEIADFCESIGIEAIPCVQTLAHLGRIFRWADYSEINDTANILLADEERTYELIENMFKSLRKCFRSECIHIGMDEAHMVGLGKYLDIHGYKNRFEILNRHLKRVIDLAGKYGFKPVMWSDMFFRLSNNGDYYTENPKISKEVIDITPKDVGLVYWDYYHEDKNIYDKMFEAHKEFGNEVWFAGGAWTWSGFAPGNKKTFDTMIPAIRSAKENGIENIFITLWGDDGKECSFYSVLPSLFALKKFYDGENEIEPIKKEFSDITGEDFDAMYSLDLPNYICGNTDAQKNPSKYMLYSDPFNGFLDSATSDGAPGEYEKYALKLGELSKGSKYSYIFESEASLCRLLAIKYSLGKRTREAYLKNDKKALSDLVCDYEKAEKFLEDFYRKFKALWYKENKPHGFDVQDLRLGGLARRLRSCKEILFDYLNGNIDKIPELEEDLLPLDFFGNKGGVIPLNLWSETATVNTL